MRAPCEQGTSKAEGSPFFCQRQSIQCFTSKSSFVVVAQSSRRSPARLEVVSSNPVGVEFFSFSFSYIINV